MAYKSPYNQARTDYLRSARRCTSCGARDERTEAGRYLCAVCWDKSSAHQKRRRERLRAAGLCYICGTRPPSEGFVLCAECAKKMAASGRRYKSRLREKASP